MSFYETLVLIHVLAAIVWVGGGILFQIQGTRAAVAGDQAGVLKVIRDSEWMGMRVFMPASIIVLAFGVWAVIDHPVWEFSDTWVSIGFAGVVISAIVGAAFLGPESGKISAAAADPEQSGTLEARINRFFLVSRVDLLILLIAVWAMITKPGA